MSSTSSLWTIINDVYDSANHALKMVISMVHTHSSATGQGGQLDWDDVWTDAAHSHASAAEGGTLDWDDIWSDAVHSHASAAEGGTLDHGTALTGLTDDDHTQYLKESLFTAQGDIPYASASGVWTVAPKGTAAQILTMNAGATAPAWNTSTFAKITSGSYAGAEAANTARAHGLGKAPKIVFIYREGAEHFQIHDTAAQITYVNPSVSGAYAVTAVDATNFYVGNATNYTFSANHTGYTYNWVAIG